jgi:hypothetical protein
MVLTGQKPTRRDRFWVRSWRVCRGPQRAWDAWRETPGTWEALVVPGHWNVRGMLAQEIRIVSHERGNPDTEVSRTLNEADVHRKENQVGYSKRRKGSRWLPGSQISP